ncbi:MAG: DNA replication and repair protein RecF, partial [Prolixibacteraceae bacterium]|nr:DNA replication and repair protein RecF [Prolixibacteraceae bacterium]
NQKKYRRFSEHIGFLPLVVVTPSDISLITGGSDGRRKFLDVLISQYDHNYLENLIRYNKAILQRNKLLKQFARQRYFKEDLLEIWDDQLLRYGQFIYEKRKVYVEKLQPIFQKYYHIISSNSETVKLIYNSQLHENDFAGILKENLKKDRILQVSTVGVHKDDLIFNIEDYPIKKIGSQGQKKTYLIALKLAQFDFVREMSQMTPILLLDDIFDKLDEYRVEEIIKLVENENFGQIFITDTNRKNLDKIIQKISVNSKIFQFKDDEIKITDENE